MFLLAIGDIVGKPGREAVKQLLPGLKSEFGIDIVVANGENIAHGRGLTGATAREVLDAGIDVLTSGNHVWAQREFITCLESGEIPVLRPLNYPPGVPGCGYLQCQGRLVVVNLIGRTFLAEVDCPFRAMDVLLENLGGPPTVIVDFHAEATSEKAAMGRYLDGRVSAVLGTHTHIATADATILPGGTAYVTDLGMTGPINSIIGDEIDNVLRRFLYGLPHRISVATGRGKLNSVMVEIDESDGRARHIMRIDREMA